MHRYDEPSDNAQQKPQEPQPKANDAVRTVQDKVLTVEELNAMKRLAPSQRNTMQLEACIRSFLFSLMFFFIALWLFTGSDKTKPVIPVGGSALILALIIGVILGVAFNGFMWMDLFQGKVDRAEGVWSSKVVGWGRSRRTQYFISGYRVKRSLLKWFDGTPSDGARCIAFLLPMSQIMITYSHSIDSNSSYSASALAGLSDAARRMDVLDVVDRKNLD